MVDIATQKPGDGPAIEHLLDLAFGPDRALRPSYRLRDGVAPVAALGFTARAGGRLVGTLRFWPVVVGGAVCGAVGVDSAVPVPSAFSVKFPLPSSPNMVMSVSLS